MAEVSGAPVITQTALSAETKNGGIMSLRVHGRLRAILLATATAAALLGAPGLAVAQDQVQTFDIPAGDGAQSLNDFARQANVQIVFPYSAVQGRSAPALKGQFTRREAASALAAALGLEVTSVQNGVVTLRSLPGAFRSPQTAMDTIEEVVVTAEKRVQDIQQVPGSVSAVGGERLNSLGLTRLSDYAKYVPGLVITDLGSPGQTVVTLRGIAPVGPGSIVGYYIDDAPMGSSSGFASAIALSLDLMPFDLDRLEVLRGPQGTLYGAGSMGGLIKYVLKQADPSDFSAQFGAELDSTAHSSGLSTGYRAAVNIPIVTDTLAIRASVYNREYQGYTDNARLDQDDANSGQQKGARIAGTWEPADNFKVNLNAFWNRTDSDDTGRVRLGNLTFRNESGGPIVYSGTPLFGPYEYSNAFAQSFSKDLNFYSGTINWDFGGLTAVSATSWSRTTTRQVQDATDSFGRFPEQFGMAAGVAKLDHDLELEKFTQELRLVSPDGGKIEWLIGAFYTDEDSVNNQQFSVLDANYQPITGPFAAIFNPHFVSAQLPSTYEEYAGFGNVTVNFTDKFQVTGGVRYAHNSQAFHQISDGVLLGGHTDNPGVSSESVLTWSANTSYHFTPQVMAYAKVATGYRPGGPNVAIPGVAIPSSVDSDTLISYEAGVRSMFLDGRALLNVTAFDIEWEGIQMTVAAPSGNANYSANAGDAFSRGFELEGSLLPVEAVRLGLHATYTQGELTRLLPGTQPFLLGYELSNVPEWSWGATADYTWELASNWRANVGGGVSFLDEKWASQPMLGAPVTEIPSYTTVDLNAGLSNDRWAVTLFARNVTDKRVYLQSGTVSDPFTGAVIGINASPLQPRVIGISVDAKF